MSLARLVVHLQANYSNLTAGLNTASTQTVVAAQKITAGVRSIRTESIDQLVVRADEAATTLENLAVGADLVSHSVESAAFSAELAAKSLSNVASTASAVGTAFSALDRSSSVATGGLQTAASVAGKAAPVLHVAASATSSVSSTLLLASSSARMFAGWMTFAGSAVRTVATGISHVSHSIHAVMIIVSLLKTALQMLMVPLRIIGSVAAFAFNALAFALRTVLLPIKLLWNGLVMTASAMWSVVKPLASMALAVAKVWFIFKGWIGSIKLIWTWLSMLPPKVRLLVGGLLALGLAGKAGAVALRVFGVALGAVAMVTRGAIAGLKLLALPIVAIVNPAAAARMALSLLAGAMAFVGSIAARAGLAVLGLASRIGGLAAAGVSKVAASFASLGASLVRFGAQAAVYGAIAASVFGVKLATAAETSRVVFGTMLHDMEQGKALLSALQSSKVAPFFDAKAIQDAGRDLLKAKVPVDQITGRLEQLGGIALATKTPIEDLSRIYRQGMAKGAFQTDLVNQMAERGIDIYAALTAVTGLQGQALADAMSDGKIGMAEMNAALDHMTNGHGIYAGVVENVSQTASGMWSQSTNNIAMALQTMFGMALEGNNGLMASFVGLTEQIKARAASIGPVVMELTNVITGAFSSLNQAVSMTMTMIFGETQSTFSSMLGSTMEWVTKFRWYFTNLVPITQFVWMNIALLAVNAFNDISYWITDKIPAYLSWFADNWQNVFRDLASGTMTVFSNLGSNIKNAMSVIWEFIKSGGTSGLEFTWTPLLDGFKATVAQLPDVPDRAMTALEQGMQEQIQTIGTGLADSYDAMAAASSEAMAAAAVVPEPVPLQSTPAGGPSVQGGEQSQEKMKEKQKIVENKAAMSRSEEGQSIAAMFVKGIRGTDDKSIKKAQINTEKHLEKLARDSDRAPRLIVEA